MLKRRYLTAWVDFEVEDEFHFNKEELRERIQKFKDDTQAAYPQIKWIDVPDRL